MAPTHDILLQQTSLLASKIARCLVEATELAVVAVAELDTESVFVPIRSSTKTALVRDDGTHVDVSTLGLGEEDVVVANVHAVVIGVELSKLQLDALHVGNSSRVLNVPALVVACNTHPLACIGIALPHEVCGLLGESLTSRVPVLEGEQLVQDLVQDSSNDSTGLTVGAVLDGGSCAGGHIATLVESNVGL